MATEEGQSLSSVATPALGPTLGLSTPRGVGLSEN